MTQHNRSLPNEDQKAARLADLALSGYALLRLSPSNWRSVAGKLLAPASRLHAFRNTRTRMWRRAIRGLDCQSSEGGGVR